MKNLGSDEVYYGVAALTVIILLVYIHAGEVIPLVGFLLSGSLVYALYPNKSVALVAGVVIATMLQMTKREGFEDDVDPPATAATATTAQTQNAGAPSPSTQSSGADTAGVLGPDVQFVSADAGALTVDSGNPPAPTTTTPPPAEAAANQTNSETQRRQRQAEKHARREARRQAQQAQQAQAAPPQGTEGLSNLNPSDMTSTEMDKLSTLIDKTTDLLKMLPDGFLAKASI